MRRYVSSPAQLVDIMQNFQIQGRQRKAAESNEKQKHDIVEMYKYPSCQAAAGEARAGLGWAGLVASQQNN